MGTMTYSQSYDISCVCFFHCYTLVVVLDGSTVVTTWELLSLLRDAWGLTCKSGMKWQSNAKRRKMTSLRLLNLVSKLPIHEVPGGWTRWRLGRFVFINQRHTGYESNRRNSSIYIPSSCLHLHSLFLPYLTHRQHPQLSRHMWLAPHNTSRSKTHPIIYTTLYVPSGLTSPTCNCIIMLMPCM